MSRSDNTRPWEMRQDDPTLNGCINHNHIEFIWDIVDGHSVKVGFVLHPCDYDPRANTKNFKHDMAVHRCTRRDRYLNYFDKTRKDNRKLARSSERAQLRSDLRYYARATIS